MNVYGLTGGPGCGKSTVSRYFREKHGWLICDADAVCHELYSDPGSECIRTLASLFGKDILAPDGTVDRKVLTEKISCGDEKRHLLNRTVHPVIGREVERRIEAMKQKDAPGILLDAPLLYEAEWEQRTDAVIAVWSSPDVQMKRLLERGWSRQQAEYRIRAQISADEKLARADYGIINDGPLDFLYRQCDKLIVSFNSLQQR